MLPLRPRTVLRVLDRAGAFAVNALEVARLGGLETGEEPAGHDVHADERVYRLLRYLPDAAPLGDRPPLVLVPPMMLDAKVYDISETTSAVRELAKHGVDPWVVDFGAPERIEGAEQRTLTDHVLAVSDAVDRVRELTGREVHLGGYSQGGMFCYEAAAYRRGDGIASLVTFGSPVDTHGASPFGLPVAAIARVLTPIANALFADRALPSWLSSTGFKLLDPVKSLRGQLDFVLQLHDREALLAREEQRRFLDGEGFVAWPGPALAEFVEQFVEHNRLLKGGFQIDDRLVTLADVAVPVLCFTGSVDEIAPAATVRAIARAAPRADLWELSQPTGHFGMVVGSRAVRTTWPAVAAWIEHREGEGPLPEGVVPLTEEGPGDEDRGPSGNDVLAGLQFMVTLGAGATRQLLRAATGTARAASNVVDAALEELPRLVRLERATRDTRISLGLVLAEQAAAHPERTFFLFESRAHTFADASRRIDAVVRGLLSLGVRQGDRVGVLMHTRPSALAAVAAISRLGAVAVLLRPDGDHDRELALGQVTRVMVDPEHVDVLADRTVGGRPVERLVLGGGGLEHPGPDVVDMERIDADAVMTPGWFRENPGRADELGFVLFTGQGARTRAQLVTNRRWSLSAFGLASAAQLGDADTVYTTTPLHHPSGLLTGIGGAIAGGARLALGTGFDPTTFWDEVRRYGATVVPYTWGQLEALFTPEPHPGERDHPVRLFVGSGMTVGTWTSVTERFAPAGVLEFYASTEGRAVLGNLSGRKVGAKGRPLPASAEVTLVRFDPVAGAAVPDDDGWLVRVADDEPGLMLTAVERDAPAGRRALRGVFAPGDAWLDTGDVFVRDGDGDHWLMGNAAAVTVRADGGVVWPVPVEDALSGLPSVAHVSVDRLHPSALPEDAPGGRVVVVASVSARPGREVAARDVDAALAVLPADERPDVVRVVDDMPLTSWHRPRHADLARMPVDDASVLWRAADGPVSDGAATPAA